MPQWEYCSIRNTDGGVEYALYRTNGAYISYLCGPIEDDMDFYKQTFQNAIATLGVLGWEAINTLQPDTVFESWYFKRRVEPGNQYPPQW